MTLPLFRAWSGTRKLDVLYIDFVNRVMECLGHDIIEGEDASILPIDNNLEEWSGLYDSKGKHIFENDILIDKYGNVGLCKYEYCCWEFVNTGGYVDSGESWTVIGNIHENPELKCVKRMEEV